MARWPGVPEPHVTEEMEAAGQAAFVDSITLPVVLVDCTEAEIETLGIILGAPIDDTFRNAVLPPGWRKVATEHSMWSDVVDTEGRPRLNVFFKAAPYDYRAFMRLA